MDAIVDSRVRVYAFDWLAEQAALHGDVFPRSVLEQGFELEGTRVPLLGPQGIFKPRLCSSPLSITTSPKSPYDDAFGEDELLRYRYRGTDPNHWENRGLREAMASRKPLVYFHGITPGKYLGTWPVFVVADDPARLSFTVDIAAAEFNLESRLGGADASVEYTDLRRRYAARQVRVRLHQRSFRERVLSAYQRQCAFCHLRHEELLDAAHVIPDAHPLGEPVVSNGLALCALHHSAFDRHFIGLRPDYTIEVRPDILVEEDGPTLAYAIQSLHDQHILLPRSLADRPNQASVERRYAQFRQAS